MKNLFNVNCDCGCGNGFLVQFLFDTDDDFIGISTVTSGFYSHQNKFWHRIFRRVRAAWFMLRGKEYYLHDIVLSKENWKRFVETVNKTNEELNS
jgi:bifunctional N-acetylglucosamine-1-phosphate-uridyltransferase/glucosamine-1-phosphate-acetyltransferase GlmU-like protein